MSGQAVYEAGVAAAFRARGVRPRATTRTGRSRTPHLDRALEKLEEKRRYIREYQRARRAKDPAKAAAEHRKHDRARRLRIQRASRARLLAALPPEPDSHRTVGKHAHTCVVPKCRKKFWCVNVCDPVGEGLNNSPCHDCFEEAMTA